MTSDINIVFWDADDFSPSMRATIQKTGRLAFTPHASERLGLDSTKYIRIGRNLSDLSDNNLYFTIVDDMKGSFKLNKTGDYYYANISVLLDKLKISYKEKSQGMQITAVEPGEMKIYKLEVNGMDDDDEQTS